MTAESLGKWQASSDNNIVAVSRTSPFELFSCCCYKFGVLLQPSCIGLLFFNSYTTRIYIVIRFQAGTLVITARRYSEALLQKHPAIPPSEPLQMIIQQFEVKAVALGFMLEVELNCQTKTITSLWSVIVIYRYGCCYQDIR